MGPSAAGCVVLSPSFVRGSPLPSPLCPTRRRAPGKSLRHSLGSPSCSLPERAPATYAGARTCQPGGAVLRRAVLIAAPTGLALAVSSTALPPASAADSGSPASPGAGGGAPALPRPITVLLEEGVQLITFQEGTGQFPAPGDTAVIHYTGRLGAKQGWRFDSTFDHKDEYGGPEPYSFVVGDPRVIKGLSAAVQSMRVGGIARAVIPPSQAYQTTEDEPLPPNFFDRQRLFTTVFNPTRLKNGEQDTLGTVIFDVRLLAIRSPSG